MKFLEFNAGAGVWANPISVCFVLGIIFCGADLLTRGQRRLSSICLAFTGTIILLGLLGFTTGVKQFCDATVNLQGLSPKQRQLMIAGGLATAINAAVYAMFTAGALVGLTMSTRVSHRPLTPNQEAGVS